MPNNDTHINITTLSEPISVIQDVQTNTTPAEKIFYYSKDRKIVYLESDRTLLDNGNVVLDAHNVPKIFENSEVALNYARELYNHSLHIQNISKADNLLVLTGAGSSLFLDSQISGKLMRDLYDKVLNDIPRVIEPENNHDTLFREIQFDEDDKKNLELLISRIETGLSFYKTGAKFDYLKRWHDYILKTIKDECSFSEDIHFDSSVHSIFLNKITTRKLSYNRTKIFTLNYDTTFEKAAEAADIVLIDGFNFSNDNAFNNNYYDYDIVKRKGSRINDDDNFLPNIAYLYKLHGSINWIYKNNKVIKIQNPDDGFVMIMPSINKYEQSYKEPYFDLMARFQTELKRPVPSTLVIIGYSFGDSHINSMIVEAINRTNFNIVIVSPSIPVEEDSANNPMQNRLLKQIEQGNIAFVGDTFKGFTHALPIQKAYEYKNGN